MNPIQNKPLDWPAILWPVPSRRYRGHLTIQTTLCLMAVWIGTLACGPPARIDAQETTSRKRPNIVFLLTDDQATISMGCYGNPEAQTPNLDRLATQGVTFDRHYVTTAICMGSRANIMTGLYEYRTGCNFLHGKMKPQHWQDSYPQRCRAAGYRTAFAGKFGFEIEGAEDLPVDDFDVWGGGPGQTNYKTAKNPSIKQYAKEYPHSSRAYGAFGRDFIQTSAASGQPFCLSISFKAPHRPVQPDPKFDHIYAGKQFTKPANYGRDSGAHLSEQSRSGRQYPRFQEWGYADNYNQAMGKYFQLIYAVDAAVGMILDALRENGVDDNTIIIFTSDNGYLCGAHGYGSKVLPYEESSSVPLIIADPRLPNSHGQRCDSLTGSIDLAPTMLDFAGIPLVPNIDGVSLRPLLTDRRATVRAELSLMNFWGPRKTHSFAVVTKKWKYVYWYSQENQMRSAEELFDMTGQRQEIRNAAASPQLLDELNQMRNRYARSVYQIKDQAVNEDYRRYATIFDRTQPWSQKVKLLTPAPE